MIKQLLYLLISLASLSVFSQETFEFKGRIIAQTADTLEINILNLTKQKGVTNDLKGYFEINVSIGDEIYFSSIPFEPLQISVTQDVLAKQPYQVFLFPKVNKLQEVIITDSGLIGIENADIKNIPLQPYITAKTLGLPTATKPLPTQTERRIYTASSSPTELLINTLNGRLKMLRKLDRYAKLDRLVEKGEQMMITQYFEDYCGIPEAYITDFMYFCAKDERYKPYLKAEDKLRLFEFFEEKGKEYAVFREWN